MSDSLERHEDVSKSVLEPAGRSVFKRSGDGLFVVFNSAGAAISAAVPARAALVGQDWTAVGELRS